MALRLERFFHWHGRCLTLCAHLPGPRATAPQFTQEGVAAMKTSVQMLKQQRAATSTADAGASLGTAMYQNCSKDMYRKRASACVSLAYQQRTSAMPSNNNNNSGP